MPTLNIPNRQKIRKKLIDWYLEHHRKLPWRDTGEPYRVWVSEVMLQQTQVNTVIPYYQKFINHFPKIENLAQADMQDVLKVWEGLGYYARARNLHKAALLLVSDEQFGGKIPNDWQAFRKLPGVGEYIASAVLSIAFGQPYAVVDGNVKRVFSRFMKIKEPVNSTGSLKIFKDIAAALMDRTNPGIHNQAVMELGALVCRPKQPLCDRCPVQSFCRACRSGMVDEYPKTIQRSPTPTYHVAAGLVYKNGHILITRRKPEGLLGGLWEFPGGKLKEGENAQTACIREIMEETGIEIGVDEFITQVTHAYTHFKIIMDVFRCRYLSGEVTLNGPVDYRWVRLEEISQYPFPKADLKCIEQMTGGKKKGKN